MMRVFWDTNLFIYLIEETTGSFDEVVSLRKAMLKNGDQLVTSALTIGEVLAKPIQKKATALVEQYKNLLYSPSIEIISFSETAAEKYAEIRATHAIKPPDALQLACAGIANADIFITNDDRLSSKNVAGIGHIIALKGWRACFKRV